MGGGLFRTLFIIFLIWAGLRLFRMYIAPYLMKKGVEKMNQKMKNHMDQQFNGSHANGSSQNAKREGEVTVEYKGKKDQSSSKVDSKDYVEFEEIE